MAMRPDMPSIRVSRRGKIVIGVLVSLFVLLSVLGSLVRVYINWLWFGEVGYRKVFSTILLTRIVLFLVVGLVMAVIIGANVFLAYRMRPPFRPISQEQENLERYRVALEPRKRLIFAALIVLIVPRRRHVRPGQLEDLAAVAQRRVLRHQGPAVPPRHLLLRLGLPVLPDAAGARLQRGDLLAAAVSLAVHYLFGAFRIATPGPKLTISARRHVTLLVFFFIVLKACAYWLDRYGLVFSGRGKVTGASYTDVNASLPAKTILFWVAVLIALAVLASLWLQERADPGDLVRGAAGPVDRHQRHLPGDRAAGHGQAERQREGSALHRAQHPGHPAGLRHRHRAPTAAPSPTRTTTVTTNPDNAALDRDRSDRGQPAHPRPERGVADLQQVPAAAQPVRLPRPSSTSTATPSTARPRTTWSACGNSIRAS